jgi:hypothetical protein
MLDGKYLMTTLSSPPRTDDTVGAVIRSLLNGGSPDGIQPEECAPWTEVVRALYDAHAQLGVTGVRNVFTALARQRPELITLVAGGSTRTPANPTGQRFRPQTLADLLSMPPKQWLLDQLLGAGDIAMVYGPPGSGKTFVVIDLVFAACLGQQFANRFQATRRLNVAYCAGEGTSGLPARFAAAATFYGITDLPNFTFFDTVPQLFYDPRQATDLESMESFILEWQERQLLGEAPPLDLLVIDTLHSATVGADENSAQDMGRALALAKLATKTLGCAVLLVHHSNRAGTGERGSSAMRGAMDLMIEIKQVGGKFAMHCEKLKDGEEWKAQTFSLVSIANSVRIWWDEPSVLAAEQVAPSTKLITVLQEQPDMKFTAKQLSEALGMSHAATINVLTRLVDKAEIRRELHIAEKPPSNRNPWVYFIDRAHSSTHDGVNERVNDPIKDG